MPFPAPLPSCMGALPCTSNEIFLSVCWNNATSLHLALVFVSSPTFVGVLLHLDDHLPLQHPRLG